MPDAVARKLRELDSACREIDVARVRELLAEGVDPNMELEKDAHDARLRCTYTVLHTLLVLREDSAWEEKAGDCVDILRALLDAGASPKIPYLNYKSDEFYPLHSACLYGNAESVEILLSAGCDPNATENPNDVYRTPLELCVYKEPWWEIREWSQKVRLLLEAGANLHCLIQDPIYFPGRPADDLAHVFRLAPRRALEAKTRTREFTLLEELEYWFEEYSADDFYQVQALLLEYGSPKPGISFLYSCARVQKWEALLWTVSDFQIDINGASEDEAGIGHLRRGLAYFCQDDREPLRELLSRGASFPQERAAANRDEGDRREAWLANNSQNVHERTTTKDLARVVHQARELVKKHFGRLLPISSEVLRAFVDDLSPDAISEIRADCRSAEFLDDVGISNALRHSLRRLVEDLTSVTGSAVSSGGEALSLTYYSLVAALSSSDGYDVEKDVLVPLFQAVLQAGNEYGQGAASCAPGSISMICGVLRGRVGVSDSQNDGAALPNDVSALLESLQNADAGAVCAEAQTRLAELVRTDAEEAEKLQEVINLMIEGEYYAYACNELRGAFFRSLFKEFDEQVAKAMAEEDLFDDTGRIGDAEFALTETLAKIADLLCDNVLHLHREEGMGNRTPNVIVEEVGRRVGNFCYPRSYQSFSKYHSPLSFAIHIEVAQARARIVDPTTQL